jgi:acetyl esterase/lipase
VNIPYSPDHIRHKLDIYLPEPSPNPLPVIVWIHGGGWQSGDKSSAATKAQPLLDMGFAVVGINYRYSSQAVFPAQLHDCRGAIRWVRAHADDYGLDPDRIGVWGSSAGGHLVALLGTSGGVPAHFQVDLEGSVGGNLAYSSRVQAVADYFGPTDFFNLHPSHNGADSPESTLVGFAIEDVLKNIDDPAFEPWVHQLEAVSSTTFASADDPSFHIAHGTADNVVIPLQSQLLHEALVLAGVPVTLRMVEGAGHGLPVSENQYVHAFFREWLALPGDVNFDNVIDITDLFAVIEEWGACIGCPADLNHSGIVDIDDLFEVISNWTHRSFTVRAGESRPSERG